MASDTPNAVANVLTLFPWIAYIHRSIDFLLASTDKADNDNDLVGSTRWALSEKKSDILAVVGAIEPARRFQDR